MGWDGEQMIYSRRFNKVPDALAKVKNSVGCLFDTSEDFGVHLEKFKGSNKDFIGAAMKTAILPAMRGAHSRGAIDYLFSVVNDKSEQSLPEWSEVLKTEASQLEQAKKLSRNERLAALKETARQPRKVTVQQTVFLRNQLVVAEVLHRANGRCEQCKNPAPFLEDSDATPYLEVHHKIRLADGGHDTVENALALCPNCHRRTHYGQKSGDKNQS